MALDFAHHRVQAVCAVHAEVLVEANAFEKGVGGLQDFCWRVIGIYAEQHGDQAIHDEGVTFCVEYHISVFEFGMQPDLRLAPLHFVCLNLERFVHGRQVSPQVDDVRVAILPVIEELELADYFVLNLGNAFHGRGGTCQIMAFLQVYP